MATYLGRNVNLALLVIIIGVIVALVGTTVFFQRSLQNRTQAYETTTGTLSDCRVALANYQQQASEAQQNATQALGDIRKYDQLYEQKSNDLQDTQTLLTQTQNNLVLEKQVNQDLTNRLSVAQMQAAQLNQTVNYQASQISSLNDQISSLYSAIDSCRAKLAPGVTC